MKPIHVGGQTFGRLTATDERSFDASPSGQKKTKILCVCECGAQTWVDSYKLRTGSTTSCGCHKLTNLAQGLRLSHGKAKSPTYRCWADVKKRCLNKNSSSYNDYGGRGITICDRWKDSFENFLADMGEKPSGMTIDRINNELGYFPENCRWTDVQTQANNKRNNTSKETLSILKSSVLSGSTLAEAGSLVGLSKKAAGVAIRRAKVKGVW